MDSEFLALSVVFMILGLVGIVLFGSAFSQYHSMIPVMTPSGDGCYCIISSPEPSAAQGTSSIFLALGVIFFPMGLMKGGLPSFGKGPGGAPQVQLTGGKLVTPVQILSGNFFALGVILLLVGVDAVLIPAYLVFKNPWFELAGVLLTAAGALAMVWGLRKPKSA